MAGQALDRRWTAFPRVGPRTPFGFYIIKKEWGGGVAAVRACLSLAAQSVGSAVNSVVKATGASGVAPLTSAGGRPGRPSSAIGSGLISLDPKGSRRALETHVRVRRRTGTCIHAGVRFASGGGIFCLPRKKQ